MTGWAPWSVSTQVRRCTQGQCRPPAPSIYPPPRPLFGFPLPPRSRLLRGANVSIVFANTKKQTYKQSSPKTHCHDARHHHLEYSRAMRTLSLYLSLSPSHSVSVSSCVFVWLWALFIQTYYMSCSGAKAGRRMPGKVSVFYPFTPHVTS